MPVSSFAGVTWSTQPTCTAGEAAVTCNWLAATNPPGETVLYATDYIEDSTSVILSFPNSQSVKGILPIQRLKLGSNYSVRVTATDSSGSDTLTSTPVTFTNSDVADVNMVTWTTAPDFSSGGGNINASWAASVTGNPSLDTIT